MEVSELHKSKRQLIELVDQKDLEISEKNSTINSYLDRIVREMRDAALALALDFYLLLLLRLAL